MEYMQEVHPNRIKKSSPMYRNSQCLFPDKKRIGMFLQASIKNLLEELSLKQNQILTLLKTMKDSASNIKNISLIAASR